MFQGKKKKNVVMTAPRFAWLGSPLTHPVCSVTLYTAAQFDRNNRTNLETRVEQNNTLQVQNSSLYKLRCVMIVQV